MNQTTPGNVSIKAALKGVFYIFDKKNNKFLPNTLIQRSYSIIIKWIMD